MTDASESDGRVSTGGGHAGESVASAMHSLTLSF